jgi:hypothetical protein
MNIHYVLGPDGYSRVTTIEYRRKTGERKATKKGTQAPRTRENIGRTGGLPAAMAERVRTSAVYPGGKRLRKAMANLTRRKDAQEKTRQGMGKGSKSVNPAAYQTPGSMRMR